MLTPLALLTALNSAPETLTLEQAIERAMRAEPLVSEASIAHDRAELALFRAKLDQFSLKVDAQIEELYNKGTDASAADGALGLSNASAALNVPLFAGFRIQSGIDRAKHLEEAAKDDLLDIRRQTALSVARAYWAVRKLGLLEEVEAKAVESLKNAEEIAHGRVAAGLAPPIDENRSRARRLREEATLADLRGKSIEAAEQLAAFLGISEEITLGDAPNIPAEALPPTAALLERAREGRPELRAANRRIRAQSEAVRIAQSGYYPQLNALGLFQVGNNPSLAGMGSRGVLGTTNPFTNIAGDFQAALTLSINLFDTFNTQTAVEDARWEESRLGEELRRAVRQVETEVRGARAKVAHFTEVLEKLHPAQDVARDDVEIIKKRYENGEALILDLLDAELELFNVERQLSETTADLKLAWLELDSVLGGDVR